MNIKNQHTADMIDVKPGAGCYIGSDYERSALNPNWLLIMCQFLSSLFFRESRGYMTVVKVGEASLGSQFPIEVPFCVFENLPYNILSLQFMILANLSHVPRKGLYYAPLRSSDENNVYSLQPRDSLVLGSVQSRN